VAVRDPRDLHAAVGLAVSIRGDPVVAGITDEMQLPRKIPFVMTVRRLFEGRSWGAARKQTERRQNRRKYIAPAHGLQCEREVRMR
jgi:hypothetical protein